MTPCVAPVRDFWAYLSLRNPIGHVMYEVISIMGDVEQMATAGKRPNPASEIQRFREQCFTNAIHAVADLGACPEALRLTAELRAVDVAILNYLVFAAKRTPVSKDPIKRLRASAEYLALMEASNAISYFVEMRILPGCQIESTLGPGEVVKVRFDERLLIVGQIAAAAERGKLPLEEQVLALRIATRQSVERLQAPTIDLKAHEINESVGPTRLVTRALTAVACLAGIDAERLWDDSAKGESWAWSQLEMKCRLAATSISHPATIDSVAVEHGLSDYQPDGIERQILEFLGRNYPKLVPSVEKMIGEIEKHQGDFGSYPTVRGRLNRLIDAGLVHRPNGEQNGFQLTPRGLPLAERLRN